MRFVGSVLLAVLVLTSLFMPALALDFQLPKAEVRTLTGLNTDTRSCQGSRNPALADPKRPSSPGLSDLELDANGCARLIVGVNASKSNAQHLEGMMVGEGANITDRISIGHSVQALAVEVPSQRSFFFAQRLQTSGLVEYVEPDSRVNVSYLPNDPSWNSQWGPQKIEADKAWDVTNGSSDILVAIVDTGIDYNHPDLAASYVPLGYNWVSNSTDPLDDFGHGTHCAGIVAAQTNNDLGISGLAQVHIMAEKVLSSEGWGWDFWVAEGIVHATDQGAKIISMSLGGSEYSQTMYDAVEYAHDHGVLLVAAAGNAATDQESYPAAYDTVIAVSATDSEDSLASFSSFGDWIDIAAPGVSILSTMPTYHVTMNDMGFNLNYDYASGTSMACPHVAGVAALAWSVYSNCSADQIRWVLENTADKLGFVGLSEQLGHGRLNARKAVSLLDHDLSIVEGKFPRRVDPGQSCDFNVAVGNYGTNSETNVTVQFSVNDSLIGSATVGLFEPFSFVMVVFSWNTTVIGSYDIKCYVVPVPGEGSTQNNIAHYFTMVRFPTTLKVRNDYQTIKAALNHSGDGDTILVDQGYYDEGQIDIFTNNITLMALGNVFVDGWRGHSAINVKADFVTLEGFEIRNSSTYGVTIMGHGNNLTRNIIGSPECLKMYYSTECVISQNYVESHSGGVFVERCSNCTITQNKLVANSLQGGMHIRDCSNNTISMNIITGGIMTDGLQIRNSQNNLIASNIITGVNTGLVLQGSPNNTLRNNTMANNYCNFCPWCSWYLGGWWSGPSDVDASNTVEGRPICYWVNVSNRVVPSDAACVILVGCENITVKNLELKDNYDGTLLVNSSSILIQGNRLTHNSNNFDRWSSGIFGLDDSFNITITQNNITRNDQGIILLGHNNTVSLNNIADNWQIGVQVSTDSIVTQNNITGQQGDGVLVGGSGCSVSFNNIMSNLASNIDIVYGSNGTVTSNNIVSNGQPDENIFGASHTGVSIQLSTNFIITLNNFIECSGSAIFTNRGSNNTIFHNNFLNNAKELGSFDLYGTSTNTWDDGYPSGGNYWSSYNGTDSDGDGVGDTPYALDANNTDNYPLMKPGTENPLPLTCSLRIIGWIGNSTIEGFYDTTYPRPGTYIFIANSTIHVDTLCRYNTVIDRWELDGSTSGTGEFVDVLMDANHTLGLFVSTVPSLNVSISPANVTVRSGGSVTFNSSLSGGKPPYDYQWCVNGSIIWDATAPTWTFTPGELGIYNITLMVSYPFSNGWTSNPTTSNAAWIVVTIPGDINGDFKVGLSDLVLLANAYGSVPGDAKWNPNADINGNNVIDLADLVIMANHYGQQYP